MALPKLTRKKTMLLVFALLAIGLVIGLRIRNQTSAAKEGKSHTVQKQTVRKTLTLSGTVAASEHVTLRFQSSGRLSWVGVAEGDLVKKYQSIAGLDSRDVKKTLEKRLKAYMNERWDFEQTADDYENTIPDDEIRRVLEKSQFDLDSSVLDVELSSLAVEYANLWTPIGGIVTKVDVPVPGVNITPASAEFEIVNPETVYLSVSADQNEVIQLKEEMKASIIIDPYPDEAIEAAVTRISLTPKTGQSNTVYEITIPLPVTEGTIKYRLGMTGDASFVLDEVPDAIAVPTSYITTEDGKKYVMARANGKEEKIEVETGDEYDDMTLILAGLREGDVIYD